jgi:uncharacterized protein YbjT (DUF2867 family)
MPAAAMTPRRLFIAGSTGATGRSLLRHAAARGLGDRVVPHMRPRGPSTVAVEPPAGAIVLDLADGARLAEALRGFTTVVQLIGTMRKRFAAGDTYETSDVGTTRQLVDAARVAGVDHVVLLSSTGAGRPFGAYLQAKARAEAIVRDSGIAHTIFRPSAFYGEGHVGIPGAKPILRALGMRRWEPIAVDELTAAILHVALQRAPLGVALEGKPLWSVVADAQR